MDAFWRQTPRTFGLWVKARNKAEVAQHRHRAWMVYAGEVLARTKKLPNFEKFAGPDPFKKQQTPEEMKAAFGFIAGPPREEATCLEV